MLVGNRLINLRSEPPHCSREFHIVVRQDVGIRNAQQCRSSYSRRSRVNLEVRIAELRHPMIRIVRRVIDTLRSPKTPIGDWDAQMVVESGEVGASTGVAHLWLERIRRQVGAFPPDVVHAALVARIGYLLSDIAQ